VYVVQRGDTLGTIARRFYGDAGAWRRIYDANRDVIGPDPDTVRVGMALRIYSSAQQPPPTLPAPAAAITPAATAARGRGSNPTPKAGAATPTAQRAAPPLQSIGGGTSRAQPTGTPGTPTPVARRLSGPRGVPPAAPYQALPHRTDPALEAAILAHLGDDLEHYAVVAKRLADGRGAALNPEQVFYAASLFKLPVMHAVFRQRALGLLRFDETLTITPPYLEFQLGTLRWPLWSEVSIQALLEAMITESDNVAAMLLYDRTGAWNTMQDLRALGLRQTDIATDAMPTSAADMARLLEAIARGQAVDEQASAEMVALLSRQKVNDRLPARLPRGTRVAHKTGNWDNATHDVGIVYAPSGPYVLAVLSDLPWVANPIAELSRLVYDAFEGAATAP
jgi:beta-lactamase class A